MSQNNNPNNAIELPGQTQDVPEQSVLESEEVEQRSRTINELMNISITLSTGKVVKFDPNRISFLELMNIRKMRLQGVYFDIETSKPTPDSAAVLYNNMQDQKMLVMAKVFDLSQDEYTNLTFEDGEKLLAIIEESNFMDRLTK
jgi:hypothetical protein